MEHISTYGGRKEHENAKIQAVGYTPVPLINFNQKQVDSFAVC
jgi:hypothetical protein